MPYQNLSSILAMQGEPNSRVERCVLVQIGCMSFDTGQYVYDKQKHSAFIDKLLERVVKALALHPNVSAPVALEGRGIGISTLTHPNILATGPLSLFHVTLPRQRLKFPIWSSGKDIEDFYAISSGSIFAAFSEVQDYPGLLSPGVEFREVMKEQLETSGIKSDFVPPVPMHPEFYLIIRQLEGGVKAGRPRVFKENENVMIALDSTSDQTAEVVKRFLLEVASDVLNFYRELMSRRAGDGLAQEILTTFSTLSNNAQAIFGNPHWRFIKSRRLSKEIRANLSSIHEQLVEREAGVLAFHQSRETFLRLMAKDKTLSTLARYFRRELSEEDEIPVSLTPALSYFENQLNLALNVRSLLVASILGAAIGAFLGSVLTWAIGLYGR
jgi:hypothetical protein